MSMLLSMDVPSTPPSLPTGSSLLALSLSLSLSAHPVPVSRSRDSLAAPNALSHALYSISCNIYSPKLKQPRALKVSFSSSRDSSPLSDSFPLPEEPFKSHPLTISLAGSTQSLESCVVLALSLFPTKNPNNVLARCHTPPIFLQYPSLSITQQPSSVFYTCTAGSMLMRVTLAAPAASPLPFTATLVSALLEPLTTPLTLELPTTAKMKPTRKHHLQTSECSLDIEFRVNQVSRAHGGGANMILVQEPGGRIAVSSEIQVKSKMPPNPTVPNGNGSQQGRAAGGAAKKKSRRSKKRGRLTNLSESDYESDWEQPQRQEEEEEEAEADDDEEEKAEKAEKAEKVEKVEKAEKEEEVVVKKKRVLAKKVEEKERPAPALIFAHPSDHSLPFAAESLLGFKGLAPPPLVTALDDDLATPFLITPDMMRGASVGSFGSLGSFDGEGCEDVGMWFE